MKENNCLWYEHFDIERPFDFRLHTSMGCGGVAKFAIYPHTEAECMRICEELSQRGQSFLVVGNLTNVLVSDLGTDKLVICTKKMLKKQMMKILPITWILQVMVLVE